MSRDEHKNTAVRVAGHSKGYPNAPAPVQSAPSNAAGQALVRPAGVQLSAQAGSIPAVDGSSPSPAPAAPISPRAAVLEAARICEAAALNIGDKYYPTMNKNCAKALRALVDTMPDEALSA